MADLPFERDELIRPIPAELHPGNGARRRLERRTLRKLAARVPTIKVIEVRILDSRAYSAVARGGSAGLGEAYFRGWFDTDDLVGLLRRLIVAQDTLNRWRSRTHHFFRPLLDPVRALRRSDKARDRKNVRAHYDLSNEFFELFLDETMTYSSAVFADESVSLTEASTAKLDRLCEKIGISSSTSVIEIGSGWGSFSLHAAGVRGAAVTTTTISAEQAKLARARIASAGLSDKISLQEVDFRDLKGTFDRLISIEMIEAVDWRDNPAFFAACANLLNEDGLMGLQAIVVADQRYHRVRVTTDFIKRWVFPGGNLPSITSIAEDATHASDLRIVDLEDLGGHYAETLHRWRDNLHAAFDQLASVGVSYEMGRLWDCYLAYCEAAFLERHISVVQVVLARSGWRPDRFHLRPC